MLKRCGKIDFEYDLMLVCRKFFVFFARKKSWRLRQERVKLYSSENCCHCPFVESYLCRRGCNILVYIKPFFIGLNERTYFRYSSLNGVFYMDYTCDVHYRRMHSIRYEQYYDQ